MDFPSRITRIVSRDDIIKHDILFSVVRAELSTQVTNLGYQDFRRDDSSPLGNGE